MTDEEADIREALKRVAAALKEAHVPFAVAGGYAGWARGGPEPDHDADVFVPEEDIEHAVRALTEADVRVERPAEDWLVKAYYRDALVDLIHRPFGRPVDRSLIKRAGDLPVDSVVMPVLDATDLLVTKLQSLYELDCDLGKVLPVARSLREQVDWTRVRAETADSPFAAAFFTLVERLGIVEPA